MGTLEIILFVIIFLWLFSLGGMGEKISELESRIEELEDKLGDKDFNEDYGDEEI